MCQVAGLKDSTKVTALNAFLASIITFKPTSIFLEEILGTDTELNDAMIRLNSKSSFVRGPK
jgi:hypothetical protein